MPTDFIQRLLKHPDVFHELCPTDVVSREWITKVNAAPPADLVGEAAVSDASALALVRGGLLYALDALDPAHAIFQDAPSGLGSYWHGMMHRREGDFENARYWFRRAGKQPFFDSLHAVAARVSADIARQSTWDPYLFTGLCEQARRGETALLAECRRVQRVEFEVVLDYCARQAVR